MKSIEYILSGTSYTRLHAVRDQPDIIDLNKKVIAKVKEETNHKFGMLYNAFVEKSFGERIAAYSDVIDSIHADSGGLQIITLGKTITPELKDQVYRVQAGHADYGMCFDEIPIIQTGVSASAQARNDYLNRRFDLDLHRDCAKLTGQNIERQIDIFLEEKTKCKPILITQGNCYDTYMEWVDIIMKTIPPSKHKYIGGTAMGAAALGTGTMEDIDRAFIYSQLPTDTKYLHVLGIGSAKRILPYIVMGHNGLYDKDLVMSYDSTTHSCGIEFGTYFKEGNVMSFTRHWSDDYDVMYDDLKRNYPWIDITKKDFHLLMNNSQLKCRDEMGYPEWIVSTTRMGIIISNVINFCQWVDSVHESKDALKGFISSNKDLLPMASLLDVKTPGEYNKWKAEVGKYIKSNRVATDNGSTLEDFF